MSIQPYDPFTFFANAKVDSKSKSIITYMAQPNRKASLIEINDEVKGFKWILIKSKLLEIGKNSTGHGYPNILRTDKLILQIFWF